MQCDDVLTVCIVCWRERRMYEIISDILHSVILAEMKKVKRF